MARLIPYAVAVAAVAASIVLRLLLARAGVQAPFLLTATAVLVAAWYGGIGPGLLATAVAALSTAGSFVPLSRDEGISLVVFVAEGVLITWLSASLRASEARQAAIVGSALDAIITLDHRGRIVEFNPAAERISGYERARAVGAEMAALLVPAPVRDAHRRAFARAVATGDGTLIGRRLEMTAQRADGREFPVELTITRIRSHGRPMFTGHLRDVTDRKAAEETARREQTLRSVATLSAATAHEINNPLAVVIGNLELMEKSETLDALSRERLQRAASASYRIQEIVAHMSRITRLERLTPLPNVPDMLDIRRSAEREGLV